MADIVTFEAGINSANLQKRIVDSFAAAQRTVNGMPFRVNVNGASISALNQPLGQITRSATQFNKSLEASTARVLAFGSTVGIIYTVQRAFRGMITEAIAVESELVKINSILKLSGDSFKQFSNGVFNAARQTGQSFEEAAEAATELAKQGLGANETLKRLNSSLILSRLSGVSSKEAVQELTAVLNSFQKQALSAGDVVNKFSAISQNFAISEADLSTAFQRAGSSAEDAGVDFDHFAALVTSLKQTTQRDGAVIGDALKSIFTRLQRSDTIVELEALGVAMKNLDGTARSATDVLKDLSAIYPTLSTNQKAYVTEISAGLFQVNQFKAAINDLGKEYSVYQRALETSGAATDEAIKRNDKLNQTFAAQINNLKLAAQQAGATFGTEILKKPLGTAQSIASSLVGLDDKGNVDGNAIGLKIGTDIAKGIGNALSGPAGLAILTILSVLAKKTASFALNASQSLIGLSKSEEERLLISNNIEAALQQQGKTYSQLIAGANSLAEAHERVLNAVRQTVGANFLKGAQFANTAEVLQAGGIEASEQGLRTKPQRIFNFADPLREAFDREKASGVPESSIYVDKDSRLKSIENPLGLLVANRIDEPLGGWQGVNRALGGGKSLGKDIPNYADDGPLRSPTTGRFQSSVQYRNEQVQTGITQAFAKYRESIEKNSNVLQVQAKQILDNLNLDKQQRELANAGLKDLRSSIKEEAAAAKESAKQKLAQALAQQRESNRRDYALQRNLAEHNRILSDPNSGGYGSELHATAQQEQEYNDAYLSAYPTPPKPVDPAVAAARAAYEQRLAQEAAQRARLKVKAESDANQQYLYRETFGSLASYEALNPAFRKFGAHSGKLGEAVFNKPPEDLTNYQLQSLFTGGANAGGNRQQNTLAARKILGQDSASESGEINVDRLRLLQSFGKTGTLETNFLKEVKQRITQGGESLGRALKQASESFLQAGGTASQLAQTQENTIVNLQKYEQAILQNSETTSLNRQVARATKVINNGGQLTPDLVSALSQSNADLSQSKYLKSLGKGVDELTPVEQRKLRLLRAVSSGNTLSGVAQQRESNLLQREQDIIGKVLAGRQGGIFGSTTKDLKAVEDELGDSLSAKGKDKFFAPAAQQLQNQRKQNLQGKALNAAILASIATGFLPEGPTASITQGAATGLSAGALFGLGPVGLGVGVAAGGIGAGANYLSEEPARRLKELSEKFEILNGKIKNNVDSTSNYISTQQKLNELIATGEAKQSDIESLNTQLSGFFNSITDNATKQNIINAGDDLDKLGKVLNEFAKSSARAVASQSGAVAGQIALKNSKNGLGDLLTGGRGISDEDILPIANSLSQVLDPKDLERLKAKSTSLGKNYDAGGLKAQFAGLEPQFRDVLNAVTDKDYTAGLKAFQNAVESLGKSVDDTAKNLENSKIAVNLAKQTERFKELLSTFATQQTIVGQNQNLANNIRFSGIRTDIGIDSFGLSEKANLIRGSDLATGGALKDYSSQQTELLDATREELTKFALENLNPTGASQAKLGLAIKNQAPNEVLNNLSNIIDFKDTNFNNQEQLDTTINNLQNSFSVKLNKLTTGLSDKTSEISQELNLQLEQLKQKSLAVAFGGSALNSKPLDFTEVGLGGKAGIFRELGENILANPNLAVPGYGTSVTGGIIGRNTRIEQLTAQTQGFRETEAQALLSRIAYLGPELGSRLTSGEEGTNNFNLVKSAKYEENRQKLSIDTKNQIETFFKTEFALGSNRGGLDQADQGGNLFDALKKSLRESGGTPNYSELGQIVDYYKSSGVFGENNPNINRLDQIVEGGRQDFNRLDEVATNQAKDVFKTGDYIPDEKLDKLISGFEGQKIAENTAKIDDTLMQLGDLLTNGKLGAATALKTTNQAKTDLDAAQEVVNKASGNEGRQGIIDNTYLPQGGVSLRDPYHGSGRGGPNLVGNPGVIAGLRDYHVDQSKIDTINPEFLNKVGAEINDGGKLIDVFNKIHEFDGYRQFQTALGGDEQVKKFLGFEAGAHANTKRFDDQINAATPNLKKAQDIYNQDKIKSDEAQKKFNDMIENLNKASIKVSQTVTAQINVAFDKIKVGINDIDGLRDFVADAVKAGFENNRGTTASSLPRPPRNLAIA